MLRSLITDAGHRIEAVGSLIAARGALATYRPDRILVEAEHPRAAEWLRGLDDLSALNTTSICLIATSEDLVPLQDLIVAKGYGVVDRALDDSVLLAHIVSDLARTEGTEVRDEGLPVDDEDDSDGDDSDDGEERTDPIYDVYKELGVDAQASQRTLVYCDMHRIADVVASLSAREQAEVVSSLLSKMEHPVSSYEGRRCMASRNGFAAIFDMAGEGQGDDARGFHAAIEMVYIAQQFGGWLRQRFPGRGVGEFAVSIALDAGEFDDDRVAGDELDPELKAAITRMAQFSAVGAQRGWSLTASAAAMRCAAEVCSAGERVAVRAGFGDTMEIFEVAAVALDSTTSVHERIARILQTNSALLRHAANLPTEKSLAGSVSGMAPPTGVRRAAHTEINRLHTPAVEPEVSSCAARRKEDVPEGVVDPETGLCVPGYRILRPLGKGGMAEVFLAVHISSGEARVLKMLPINDGEEEQLQRFIQEYALISQIRDANVARIFEQGFTETHAYISMEYLPGGELRAVIKRGLTVEQALDWTAEIAGALVAVHAKGIAHRDLKPANLMLRADGSLALADFGIAKGQSDLLNRTASGHIVGSPYYLSPEQAESKAVDARCDLYSLGIMLFEMLTGKKPFRASNLSDLIRQHVVAPIPQLPADLAQFQPLIEGLLAKKPSDRIASAELLLSELKTQRMAYDKTQSGTSLLSDLGDVSTPLAVRLNEVYSVAVIGFDETEKIVLDSTLGLSVRRKPRFVGFDASRAGRPDLYLVDARDMLYLQTMLVSNLDRAVPTVLIGNSDFGTRWPVLKRPIQWSKIFEAFDHALRNHERHKHSAIH